MSKMFSQPCRLAGNPGRVFGMIEAGMIRHDAEDIDVLCLGLEIDGQLVFQRPVEFGVGPGAMECAQQGFRSRLVDDRTKLADPVGKDVAPPLYPRVFVFSQQELRELRRGCQAELCWYLAEIASGNVRRNRCPACRARPAPNWRGCDDNRARYRQSHIL